MSGDDIFKKLCFSQVHELYRANDPTPGEMFVFYAHSYLQLILTKPYIYTHTQIYIYIPHYKKYSQYTSL